MTCPISMQLHSRQEDFLDTPRQVATSFSMFNLKLGTNAQSCYIFPLLEVTYTVVLGASNTAAKNLCGGKSGLVFFY